MLKLEINMRMPASCVQCPFYTGSRTGGECIATNYGLYFAGTDVIYYRHKYCPLKEEEDG